MCVLSKCVSDMLCPYGRGFMLDPLKLPDGAHGGGFHIRKRKVHIEPLGMRMERVCARTSVRVRGSESYCAVQTDQQVAFKWCRSV